MIIKLADVYFEIHNLHSYIEEYCKDYLVQEAENPISIQIHPKDIDFERNKSLVEDEKAGILIRHFTDEYLETLAVYRKIADELLAFDTLLFHGSVVCVDGRGYLFTAKSGTGKSTHTRLWREYFGSRAVMINDDKPLLCITKDGVRVYGSPWDGKHRLNTNTSVPLHSICILSRDKVNHIELVSKREVYPLIVQQTNRSLIPTNMPITLRLIDELLKHIPIYKLGCNQEIEAVRVAYEGMKSMEGK